MDSNSYNYGAFYLTPLVVKLDNGSFRVFFKINQAYVSPAAVHNPNGGYTKIYLTIKIYE